MTETDHSSRDHAQLGASSCYRWWNCPGCFRMAALLGATSSTSVYAMEGTAAHQLCHWCLLSGQDAIEYLDRRISVGTHVFFVDHEMAAAVQIYIDVCRQYQQDGWEILIEKRFSLKKLNPPGPMFGTADFVAVNRSLRKVVVVDFKYGKGIVVEIQNNPQLMYYALGVVCVLDLRVQEIETVIVQPRVSPKPKSATYRATQLFEWGIELLAHAKATLDPEAPCVGGPWCRSTFCPASGRCLAEADAAFAAAQLEFTGEVLEGEIIPPEKLPALAALTPQQLGNLKKNFETLKGFMKSVDEALLLLIEHGAENTGFKRVVEEGNRQWIDEDTVSDSLSQIELSFEGETDRVAPVDTVVTKVVSPAQAEKIMVWKLRTMGMKAKDAESTVKRQLAKLTVRPPTKPKLVSDTNELPALPAKGSEFKGLPAFLNEL